ncbi:MAG: LysR family transcriptional regulator [Aristaeellaceae bacterium]
MDIMKYRLFVEIADTGSFTKSGRRMGYSQPAVSHMLKSMEDELGFPLFVRTKQSVSLTANAKAILPYVRKLLAGNEQLEQVVNALNGLQAGHLTIAAFASISRNWLPRIIRSFEQRYPGIEIELLEGGTDEIVGWVRNSIADFGLLSRPHTETLSWVKLLDDPLMAILPENEPCAQAAYPISRMAQRPFIISADGVDYDMHQALESAGITPNIHLSCKDDHSIASMVASGLGVSILPRLVIQDMGYPLRVLPLEPYATRELGIAYRAEASLTPAAKQFIRVVQEMLLPRSKD